MIVAGRAPFRLSLQDLSVQEAAAELEAPARAPPAERAAAAGAAWRRQLQVHAAFLCWRRRIIREEHRVHQNSYLRREPLAQSFNQRLVVAGPSHAGMFQPVQPLPQSRVKEIGEMLLINAASQMTLQRPHYSSAAYVPAASERHRSQNVRYRRVAVAA